MDSYIFSDLRKQYNNFFNPTFKIFVDGKALPEDFYFDELDIELTTELLEVGSARMELSRKGDITKQADSAKLLASFPLMGKIKIDLGYNNTNKTVFEGIIFERSLKIKSFMTCELTVTCLDKKALFRLNNTFSNYALIKSFSALVNNIVSKYGLNAKIDSTPKFGTPITVNQNGVSDFDYIAGIAQDLGYEFFVLNQDFYFRNPGNIKDTLITLERGSLYNIEHRTSMAGIYSEIKIFAYNQDKKEEKTASCKAVENKIGSGRTGSEILKSNNFELISYESIYMNNKTAKDVSVVAGIRLRENSALLTELYLSTDGLPELIPGKFIKLANALDGIDNTYYLKKARHIFKENTYRAELTCCSNTTEN